ncbi:MAG: hypothetical protein KKA32_09060 [Actinobacteria bacterium]|nr:hypothetical protein [Actinomycetota bacterium]
MAPRPPLEAGPAIEGFAVETHDGLVFTVKGLFHPAGRVIAYLRYAPDPTGDRKRGGRRYRRVYRFEEQEAILRARRPAYLVDDPMLGVPVQAVPEEDIGFIYDPRLRLQHLAERGPEDPLEETALALTQLLRTAAGVPPGGLGLTGSLLVGLHRPSSDIDIVAYGEHESRAIHGALSALLDDPTAPVRRPEGEELAAIHDTHRADTPLSAADFVRLQARKVNEGYFADRSYFVRFVKRPDEVGEAYGDPRYESLGSALIRARVHDDREAMFTPCRYLVDGVTYLEGKPVEDLLQIVSFRGRFADQAKAGDWVIARGELELVVPRRRSRFCRLTVGGQSGDYLLGSVA